MLLSSNCAWGICLPDPSFPDMLTRRTFVCRIFKLNVGFFCKSVSSIPKIQRFHHRRSVRVSKPVAEGGARCCWKLGSTGGAGEYSLCSNDVEDFNIPLLGLLDRFSAILATKQVLTPPPMMIRPKDKKGKLRSCHHFLSAFSFSNKLYLVSNNCRATFIVSSTFLIWPQG